MISRRVKLHEEEAGGPYICPECPVMYATPEELGPHIERHRPVEGALFNQIGEMISRPCPQGCGRFFARGRKLDFHAHVKNCDGSRPLYPVLSIFEVANAG